MALAGRRLAMGITVLTCGARRSVRAGSPRSVLQNARESYAMVDPALFPGLEVPTCNLRVPVPVWDPRTHQAASIDQKRGTKIAAVGC
jgi:hypothetical protein